MELIIQEIIQKISSSFEKGSRQVFLGFFKKRPTII